MSFSNGHIPRQRKRKIGDKGILENEIRMNEDCSRKWGFSPALTSEAWRCMQRIVRKQNPSTVACGRCLLYHRIHRLDISAVSESYYVIHRQPLSSWSARSRTSRRNDVARQQQMLLELRKTEPGQRVEKMRRLLENFERMDWY